MYETNDTVMYSAYGICKISEIIEKKIDDDVIECYILQPVHNDRCNIVIPVANKKATAKMQPVLSPKGIYELIKAIPAEKTIWIDNTSTRKKRYEEILSGGDRRELVSLIKTLYQRRNAHKENGKKLHSADEHALQDAEKILYEEIAHVLHMDMEQVPPFIFEQIHAGNSNQIM